MGRKEILPVIAVGVLLLAAVGPASAESQGGEQISLKDAQPKPIDCIPALYPLLPGAFNYCVAMKQWHRGHIETAIELMELAAGWGNKTAQMTLGIAYFNADGVQRDRARGLAWLALAAEREDATKVSLYRAALSQASRPERLRADRLYQSMRARYADNVAAARADRRFRRELRALRANPVYGSGTCIAGLNAPSSGIATAYLSDQMAGQSCSLASEEAVVVRLEQRYEVYFGGWEGRATVGPLQQMKASRKP